MGIQIRSGKAEDYPFIVSTWLKGQHFGNDWFAAIDKNAFYTNYSRYIDNLVAKSTVLVACLSEDEDVILGYSISSSQALHWVFVKKPWRGQGIAKSLVVGPISVITSITKPGLAIAKKQGWKFDPWNLNK